MEERTFKEPYKPRFASSRDFDSVKTFGAAPLEPLPKQLLNVTPIVDQGNKPWCTAAASISNRRAMTGKEYDLEKQWKLEIDYTGEPYDSNGLSFETPAEVGKKVGFVPIGQTQPTDKVGGYFWVNKMPGLDYFDTLRYTQYQLYKKYKKVIPLQVALNWFREWESGVNGIIPDSQGSLIGGHDTLIIGFETYTDGKDYVVNQNSWGEQSGDKGLYRFGRSIANKVLGVYGVFYWLEAEDMPDNIKRLGIWIQILQNIKAIYQVFVNRKNQKPKPIIPPDEVLPPPAPPIEPTPHTGEEMNADEKESLYEWDTPAKGRHSVRVICDEEKLSYEMKNELCDTVKCETGGTFSPGTIGHKNPDGTQDWGIAQINDYFWIGPGKRFPSTLYVLQHPAECIRWMCANFKNNHAGYWVCHNKLFGSIKVADEEL